MKIKTHKIRRILKAKGMTLDDLAKKMGLGSRQAAAYRIESACSLRTIEGIAKALKVKVSDII
jgi:transcriptional regulator with XRE-family HTH domain